MTLLSDLEGRLLGGRYEVREFIAKGGMGSVFKAWDTRDECWVVIKTARSLAKLKQEGFGEGDVSRLKVEEIALFRLSSPHIVRLLDVGEDEQADMFFIVLEYIEGEDLTIFTLNDVFPNSIHVCVKIMLQLVKAAEAFHEEGIIHLDLKPANIRVSKKGVVKVLDFGLAKFIPEPYENAYAAGTPFYLSPEQIRESHNLDFRSDIFNLGIILYELLTSQSPFDKFRGTVGCLRKPLRPFPKHLRIPKKIQAIALKAMSLDREDRYQTAEEMRLALVRVATPFSIKQFVKDVWGRVRTWTPFLK